MNVPRSIEVMRVSPVMGSRHLSGGHPANRKPGDRSRSPGQAGAEEENQRMVASALFTRQR
ncbi:MAG TPA: hypothetical protein VLJ62_09410, partial [Burkholderiaceae bacterium]|nr:hypothetical protein [Burkholderiaceae bacterium]